MEAPVRIASSSSADPRAQDFVRAVRLLAIAGNDPLAAMEIAIEKRSNDRILSVLKTAVSAGTTTHPQWAAPLSATSDVISGFLSSLRSVGAFDKLLPAMLSAPPRTRIVLVTTGAVGSSVGEGATKTISSLSLSSSGLTERKAAATIIVSDELARHGGAEAAELFAAELRSAVAKVTDEVFVSVIVAGLSPIVSSGSSVSNNKQDVASALAAIQGDSQSKYYLLLAPNVAKAWAGKTTAGGDDAFPDLGPNGGQIGGAEVIVSDAVAATQMFALDAAQLIGWAGSIGFDETHQATLQLNTSPDSPPTGGTTLTSLWQQNMKGIRVERWLGVERPRITSVSMVTGIVG